MGQVVDVGLGDVEWVRAVRIIDVFGRPAAGVPEAPSRTEPSSSSVRATGVLGGRYQSMTRSTILLLPLVALACGGPAFNDACPADTHVEGKDCVKYVAAGAGGVGGAGSAGAAGKSTGQGGAAAGSAGTAGSAGSAGGTGGASGASGGMAGKGGSGGGASAGTSGKAGTGGSFSTGGASGSGAGGGGGVAGAGGSTAGASGSGGAAGGGAAGTGGAASSGASGGGGASGTGGIGPGGSGGFNGGAGGMPTTLLSCSWEGNPGAPHTVIADLSTKVGAPRQFARPPIAVKAGLNGARIFATDMKDAANYAPMKMWTVGLLQSVPITITTVQELPAQVQRIGSKVVLLTILNNGGATNEYDLLTIDDTDPDGSNASRDLLTSDLNGRVPDGGAVFPDGTGGWILVAVVREAQASLYVEHYTGTTLDLTTPKATAALTEMGPVGFLRSSDAIHAFLRSQTTGAITQYTVTDAGVVTTRPISTSDVQFRLAQGSADTFDYTFSDPQAPPGPPHIAVEPLANISAFMPAAAPLVTWQSFGDVSWQQDLALTFGRNQTLLGFSIANPASGALAEQTMGNLQFAGSMVSWSQPVLLSSSPSHVKAAVPWVESATDAQGSFDALMIHTLNCQ